MAIERDVLVVSKTHLDVGFTDLAARVVQRYLHELVPAALDAAQQLRRAGGSERLTWTVGSWLVTEALERSDRAGRRRLEEAIEAGDLAWHAWPLTTHSGLLDRSLAEWAPTLSARLDERFGRRTVAAKMTDVPGHPRTLVPVLAHAGIRLLHLGVNPASTPPDVPAVFRWRDLASATEVVVIYQRGAYGGAQPLPGTGAVLVVDHTGDNLGPPTVGGVRARRASLAAEHPGSTVRAARLDDAWHALDRAGAVEALPVVTSDLGDTWIHGAASDPTKLARYRALCRVRAAVVAEAAAPGAASAPAAALEQASRSLLLVAEHTWGLDEKTHLHDGVTWSAVDLATARAGDPRFALMERSWAEQRAYVDDAAEALRRVAGARVDAALAATVPAPIDVAAVDRPERTTSDPSSDPGLRGQLVLEGAGVRASIDGRTGALVHLATADGRVLADEGHTIGRFGYQTFDETDDERWWREYVTASPDDAWWAREDQTKPGMSGAVSRWWDPVASGAVLGVDEVRVDLRGPDEAVQRFGCPARLALTWRLAAGRGIDLSVDWFDKPACRLPEALWLGMHPATSAGRWSFDVLGRPLDPLDVVPDGGRGLHAVDRWVECRDGGGSLRIESLDAALVAPGQPMLRRHVRDLVPDLAGAGVSWLLADNVWGTNFPMWVEGDARFRFALRWDDV